MKTFLPGSIVLAAGLGLAAASGPLAAVGDRTTSGLDTIHFGDEGADGEGDGHFQAAGVVVNGNIRVGAID